jgi:U3 small nucleolar RNA-associated protein 3
MQELAGSGAKRGKGESDSDADADDVDFGSSGRKRRRAPENDDDGEEDDGGANVFDDFVSKKKDYLSQKKAHYTAEPRYGGFEESVNQEKGEKRAASYEIIKNRGLTPHRKKENRNPRVKKREKYEKALIARKGQVREVKQGSTSGGYGGETTGIKSQVARSRKL